ncbi:MAG TPA: AraC family transcriptional regulator [Nocardioides sp.]|nr:AraC family transcriptional regulator [Nocardioides sp.]
MATIRGTSLQGYLELMEELGGDAGAVLSTARIPVAMVGSHDHFLDHRRVIHALEGAAEATGARDFGRRLALRQGLEILGPVGVAARTAPTVGAALQAVNQYLSFYSPALAIEVTVVDDEHGRFTWAIRAERPPPHVQSAELSISLSIQVFRLLAGGDFRPTTVFFRHEPLVAEDEYRRYYGTTVRFSADEHGFTFKPGILDRRLSSDHAVHQVVQDYLSGVVTPLDDDVTQPVRLLVRRMLSTGGLSLDLVATHLAVHPRTLQRQLAAEGRTFADVVDEVRRAEAEQHLGGSTMPLSQVAGLLGYAEQSVLSRSCQRWFGKSPSAYRREAMSGSAGR